MFIIKNTRILKVGLETKEGLKRHVSTRILYNKDHGPKEIAGFVEGREKEQRMMRREIGWGNWERRN